MHQLPHCRVYKYTALISFAPHTLRRLPRRRRRRGLALRPRPSDPVVDFWQAPFGEPVDYIDPEPQPPMQLPDPLADLLEDLHLQPQDIRWPSDDPRILFLYLALIHRVDLRIQSLGIISRMTGNSGDN